MSFQDLEAGRRPLASRKDLINAKQDPTQAVASGIFQINTAVNSFQRLVNTLGTPKDTPQLRDKLHKTRLHIGQLVKDTSAKLKQASETDHGNNISANKKVADAKLAKDFQAVLKEFQKAQRVAAERETAYAPFVPQSALPSSYTASEADVSADKTPEQRALLVEARRQEVLLLDNELSFNESVIEEREQGIQEIQQQIGEVNEIFKDLAVLVHDQGAVIDDIGSNVENAHAATSQARSHLAKASKSQRSNSSLTCLLLVLSSLPAYEGKSVLLIGTGISHLTGELAKKAGQVVAVDLSKSVSNENDSANHQNVKFVSANATSPSLDITLDSCDLIFADSVLVHLSDDEVKKMVQSMAQWLKPLGHIFFTEACSNDSPDRDPKFYSKVFKECRVQDESGNSYELSVVGGKCNQNKICWTWQKVASENDKGFQQFLDTVQYKANGILRYERVFGPGYVSTGGLETTREFVSKLDLKPGQKVLDVGCGIGGGDFYMAEKFNVEVVGIDLSINMISIALERAVGLNCAVEFKVADCTTITYPDSSFDVIYSRDTILHIQDKPALFRSFYKWLKPGGKVLISDYCRNAGTPSPEFAAYIKQRGYDLHDVQAYGQMLRDAGFDKVIAEDRTDQFLKVLQREVDAVEKEKERFIADFSEGDYNDIVGGWKSKLVRSSSGEQRWGLFIAEKAVKN